MNSPSSSRTNAGDASEALRSLRRGLERAHGFALFVAIVKTPAQCHELITLLREAAPALQLQTVTLRPDTTDILDDVLRQAGPDLRGPVMIVGLDAALPSDATAHPLLQALNLRRPEWPQLVRQPVVLWVPGHLYGLLARAVPDFLDWRSDTLHFPKLEPAHLEALHSARWEDGLNTRLPATARMERIRELESRLTANEANRDPAIQFTVGGWLNELGLHLSLMGRVRQSLACFEKALAIARELGVPQQEGATLDNLGNAYSSLGNTPKAIACYELRLSIARETNDRQGEGRALGNLGIAYKDMGDASRAIGCYEQALGIMRDIRDRRGEGAVLGNLASAYSILGDFPKAVGFYEQALIIMRDLGDYRAEGSILGNMGAAYKNLGETRKAIGFYEKALVMAREIGDQRAEGVNLGNLGNAYASLGDPGKALQYYDQSLTIARLIGDQRGEGYALFNSALALDNLDKHADAIALAEAGLKILEPIEDPTAAKVQAKLAEWRGK